MIKYIITVRNFRKSKSYTPDIALNKLVNFYRKNRMQLSSSVVKLLNNSIEHSLGVYVSYLVKEVNQKHNSYDANISLPTILLVLPIDP